MKIKRVLPDDLARLWVKQLYIECEHILFWYDLSGTMKPAVIIVEAMRNYGEWRPETRTIAIADHLIKKYPWNVVIEILKHEMAHQFVTEVRFFKFEKPHGGEFKDACRRLGVPAWASAASGELPTELGHSMTRKLTQEEEALLRRAEKLLALAESTNEHEAQLAMQLAQEIFARHNLDGLRVRQGSDMTYAVIRLRRKRTWTHEQMIVGILVEHFFVYVVGIREFCPIDCTEYVALEVMGAPENVTMAEYVFYFLQRAVNALWDDHAILNPSAHRLSFQRGVIDGFRQKLKMSNVESAVGKDKGLDTKAVMAIAASGKALIVNTIGRERHPKIQNRGSGGGGRIDGNSFNAGKTQGGKVVLHKGIGTSAGNRGHLLRS